MGIQKEEGAGQGRERSLPSPGWSEKLPGGEEPKGTPGGANGLGKGLEGGNSDLSPGISLQN